MNVITFEVWDYKARCRALLEMYYEGEYELPSMPVRYYAGPGKIGPVNKKSSELGGGLTAIWSIETIFFHYN